MRWNLCIPRRKKDGGTFWHTVGSAFDGDKGITLVFNSLPLPDAEGRCVVKLFEPRGDARPAEPRSGGYGDDDEIPF